MSRSAGWRRVLVFFSALLILLFAPVPIWLAVPGGFVVLWYVFHLGHASRDRQIEELAHGCTTLPRFEGGGMGWHVVQPWHKSFWKEEWVFSGAWVLERQTGQAPASQGVGYGLAA